jgi:hypothetical protein
MYKSRDIKVIIYIFLIIALFSLNFGQIIDQNNFDINFSTFVLAISCMRIYDELKDVKKDRKARTRDIIMFVVLIFTIIIFRLDFYLSLKNIQYYSIILALGILIKLLFEYIKESKVFDSYDFKKGRKLLVIFMSATIVISIVGVIYLIFIILF